METQSAINAQRKICLLRPLCYGDGSQAMAMCRAGRCFLTGRHCILP
jgi:hypothetical protein